MSFKPLILALSVAFSPIAFGGNLSDAYRAAAVHDATYAAAQSAYRAAQERIPQARAGLLPNIGLNANTRYNDVEGSLFSDEFNSNSWGVQAVQPIYRAQNFVSYGQAKVSVQQAEYQLKASEQGLILRTARAYIDVLAAQDNLAFTLAQKDAFAEQLASAKRNFEVGTATVVDTHEAQARYDLAFSQEITARNVLEIKRRALRNLTGREVNTLATLTPEPMPFAPDPANVDEWVSLSQQDNLDVRIRQQAKEIADKEIDRTRAGHHPTLDLTAGYTDASNQNFGTVQIDTKSTVIGLEFALPLYQGGLVSSQVREAVANQERVRQELEDALRNAALQTRDAYYNVLSTQSQVKALEAALASSVKSLESTQVGLEVGVRTNIDVLNAQQQVTSAQKDLALARYLSLLALLDLKASAGTLTAADLEYIDGMLVATQ
ncbi:MAG: TolC family outer membrane protein [Thiobacillus sp.]